MGIDLGRGEDVAGWRWGKGKKVGRTIIAQTIQKENRGNTVIYIG